ncbi:MAG: hypothetical protein ACREX3_15615 [Gammaproteobacteria bacterium]
MRFTLLENGACEKRATDSVLLQAVIKRLPLSPLVQRRQMERKEIFPERAWVTASSGMQLVAAITRTSVLMNLGYGKYKPSLW